MLEMCPDRCLTGDTNFVGGHCWLPASFHDFPMWAKCALRALECLAKKQERFVMVCLFPFGLRSELSGSDCCEALDTLLPEVDSVLTSSKWLSFNVMT